MLEKPPSGAPESQPEQEVEAAAEAVSETPAEAVVGPEDSYVGERGVTTARAYLAEVMKSIAGRRANAENLHGTRDTIRGEWAIAARAEGGEEGARILREALDDVQARLEAIDPKEKVAALVEAKFTEAEALFAKGELTGERKCFVLTVAALYSMLITKQFVEHITYEQRIKYVELMNVQVAEQVRH